MPSVSFTGMATGLPPNLVEQLIEAERMPIKNLEAQRGKSEDRLKLVNELDTKISNMRNGISELASTKGFADIKLSSGDPNIVSGSVDPSRATSGSWNVEVLELAQRAAVMTNGFPDKDKTELGVGYFKFNTPEGKKEVYISRDNNTLEGAASAINMAKIGIRASVVNDRREPDAPFKLVLSSTNTGEENKVEYPTLYFLDGDQDVYFEGEKEPKNGLIRVDGFEFAIADNTVTDVIPGVTLDIRQAAPGRNVNITVKEDLEVVVGKVKTFVDSMNEVFSFIQKQNKLTKDTDTSRTLGGDGLLRSVEQRLRQLVQNPQYGVNGPIKTLNQLGIKFTRNGLLEFDNKGFANAVARNPEGVQKFFVGDGFNVGFIPALKREISTLTNSAFGPLGNRKSGLQQKIDDFNRRIETKQRGLEKKEEQLRDKFSRLEETVSRIKSQGGSLAAMGGGIGLGK